MIRPATAVLTVLLCASGCGRLGYSLVALGDADAAALDASVRVDAGDGHDGGRPPDGSPGDAGPLRDGGADDSGAGDAGSCSETPCRLVLPQCGCPSGQMCTRTTPGSPARSCAPNGSTATARRCTFSTECQPGHACVQANGAGVCALWCEDDSACSTTSECLQLRVTDPVGACRIPCDAVRDTGCPMGMSCYVAAGSHISGSTTTFTLCAGAGIGALGSRCAAPFDCQPGLACPRNVCVQLCDVDAPMCAMGSGCNSLGWSADGVRYGECR